MFSENEVQRNYIVNILTMFFIMIRRVQNNFASTLELAKVQK